MHKIALPYLFTSRLKLGMIIVLEVGQEGRTKVTLKLSLRDTELVRKLPLCKLAQMRFE